MKHLFWFLSSPSILLMVFLIPLSVNAQANREHIITVFDSITYFPDSCIHAAYTIKKGVPNGYAIEFGSIHKYISIGEYKNAKKVNVWYRDNGSSEHFKKGEGGLLLYPGCNSGLQKAKIAFQTLYAEQLQCPECRIEGKYHDMFKHTLIIYADSSFDYFQQNADTVFFTNGNWKYANDTVFFKTNASDKMNKELKLGQYKRQYKNIHLTTILDFDKLVFKDNYLFRLKENGKIDKKIVRDLDGMKRSTHFIKKRFIGYY